MASPSAKSQPTAAVAGITRYQQVAAALLQEITDGVYAVGAQLPTEMDLCQRFGVSRYTVREAMRRLRDAGLITQRRGSGTTVLNTQVQRAFNLNLGSVADLLQYVRDTKLDILSLGMERVDEAAGRLLDCAPETPWLKLMGLRHERDPTKPIALTAMYMHQDLASLAPKISTVSGALMEMIEAESGQHIATVEQHISAVTVGAHDATLLRVDTGSPALRTVRRFYDTDGQLLQLSDSVHPGARFTYTMRFERNQN